MRLTPDIDGIGRSENKVLNPLFENRTAVFSPDRAYRYRPPRVPSVAPRQTPSPSRKVPDAGLL